MNDTVNNDAPSDDGADQAALRTFELALRDLWRLGQNVFLCWRVDGDGLTVLFAPHYYLGNFSASLSDSSPVDRLDVLNGQFMRKLISSERRMNDADFFSTARRLGLKPTLISAEINSNTDAATLQHVEELFKRYSISYVESRAVLLLDIVDFSLFTPFEQTSQLNSLSYSLNSAYSKLLKIGIEVEFARTTTGDGFYVWNRAQTTGANQDLFLFMLLVIADNAIARRKARGHIVPLLRTAFHIGSHFEFYQVEGVNPTLYSYIVGDVTIELARMVEIANPGQIFVGDFNTRVPTSTREEAFLLDVDSQHFVQRIGRLLEQMRGLELSGERIESMHCQLTGETGASAGQSVRRFRITDKHGRSRCAYNLRLNIHTSGGRRPLILGIQGYYLPKPEGQRSRGVTLEATVQSRRRIHQPRLLSEE
ncbi:MAG: hypothetical protein ABW049_14005 [Spongiibacteraceae bacterium]